MVSYVDFWWAPGKTDPRGQEVEGTFSKLLGSGITLCSSPQDAAFAEYVTEQL